MTMNTVLHSFTYSLDYLREQVRDVSDADMAAQPIGIVNHPAWVIGHLTVICQTLGGVIGLPEWLPDGWSARFDTGSVPVADHSRYEAKARALAMLDDARQRLVRAVEDLSEARLEEPFPDEPYRVVFPTIRHALTQVLVGHSAYHVGQVGVWRRDMGLPPMTRPFE
jgi:hypothetical protein